jgi:hypothetical protein
MRLWRATVFTGLLIVTLLCQVGFVSAEQHYNAFENRWETAPGSYDLKSRSRFRVQRFREQVGMESTAISNSAVSV